MPPPLQAKLLRVIQERVVEPVGSNRQVPLDVRFIAATKADLKAESDAGRFRADLYFRLATVTLEIPPLKRRGHDIALLFRHFCANAARRHRLEDVPVTPPLADALRAADWPGNVRELKSAAERHVLGLPALTQLSGGSAADDAALSLPTRLAAYERLLISDALAAHGGNIHAASIALGIPRRTLSEKIARLGIARCDRPGDAG